MSSKTFITAAVFLAAISWSPVVASADQRGHGRGRDQAVGRAVPRTGGAPRGNRPEVVRVVPSRPYRYGPRYDVGLGFYSGYPYRYYPYSYYPYGYSSYGYYPPYGYGYPAPGYLAVGPGRAYGSVRITDAPRDAQVFADGYYVGTVDDFDGTFQHLNLEAGPHRIEIRAPGRPPIAFDVDVRPGETIKYRADVP